MPAPLRTLQRWLAAALVCAIATAQHDPISQTVTVQVLSLEEGLPMPGVLVYHVPSDAPPATGMVDGWLRADHAMLRQWLGSRIARSDPDGIAKLQLPESLMGTGMLRAGPPFRGQTHVYNDRPTELRVSRLEQFVVRAIDADGEALVDFPLALRDGSNDIAVARTDARGSVIFGIEPRIESRLRIVPFGWIGPTDPFPTVAKQLPGKFTTLNVPGHGMVRLRALVQGKAAPAAIARASLHEPNLPDLVRGGDADQPTCHGVLLGPVALGVPLRGTVQIGQLSVPFATAALSNHGEERIIDVETDPPRPKFALRCVGAPAGTQWLSARAIVWTDVGAFAAHLHLDAEGHALLTPDGLDLRGDHLVRIDVDATCVAKDGSTLVVDGSYASRRQLTAATHELGDIVMTPSEPLVRGRVVGANGKPEPGCLVTVAADPASGFPLQTSVPCDDAGNFVVTGLRFRGRDGELLPLTVTPQAGLRGQDRRGDAVPVPRHGALLHLALPDAATGALTVSLRTPLKVSPHQLQFAFVDAAGTARQLAPDRLQYGGEDGEIVRLLGMRLGRGTLHIRLRSGGELLRVPDLEVADPERSDARLRSLDLQAAVRTVSLRIVDEVGVPLRGAIIEAVLPSERVGLAATDQGGRAELVLATDHQPRLACTAEGKQTVELATVQDGMQVTLGPRSRVRVAVTGLPADLPRGRIEVMFRSVVRDNLGDSVWARLGEGDVADSPLPAKGSYTLRLVVRRDGERGASYWSQVGERDGQVHFDGRTPPAAIEFALDAATLARLREELAK